LSGIRDSTLLLTLGLLLMNLAQTGKLVYHKVQRLEFLRGGLECLHLLLDALSDVQDLGTNLIKTQIRSGVCLWCRHRGSGHGRVDSLSCRQPKALSHLIDIVDSALSESEPKRSQIKHSDPVIIVVVVIVLVVLGSCLRRLAGRSLSIRRGLSLLIPSSREVKT